MTATYHHRALVQETAKVCHASLKDINWQIKLIMSSDKLSNIKEPLINVEFDLATEEGIKKTCLEMNKAELKSFIESLEAANKFILSNYWVNMDQNLELYKHFADCLKEESHRNEVTLKDIEAIKDQLALLTDDRMVTVKCLLLAYEMFRCLRNMCIHNVNNQNCIIDSGLLLTYEKYVAFIIDPHYKIDSELLEKTKVMTVQFLGNLIVQNVYAKKEVWKIAFPTFFFKLMADLNTNGKNCLCMVVYNCLKENDILFKNEDEFWLLSSVIEFAGVSHDSEWGLLVIEFVIISNDFKALYQKLNLYPTTRAILLDVLHSYLLLDDNDVVNMVEDNIIFLVDNFETKSSCIFMLAQEVSDELQEESVLLLKKLSILCIATSHYKFEKLRGNEKLLKTIVVKLGTGHVACIAFGLQSRVHLKVIDMLISLELLNQIDRNEFSSYFSKPGQPGLGEEEHLAYGFKRDMVRTIGNMCYENKVVQDKIRELDGIRLVLNGCNIDDRNPFMMQWAIFAIRNICDKNPKNQQYIKSLEKRELVHNPLLADSNITTSVKNGKITISSKGSLV